jgi:hypothetical protein
VNGQQAAANNLQFEGIDDNERTGELQVYILPAAAIQTVDVKTSNYTPEFGRAAGAVTNVTMKSGTNQFHGSAYEFNSIAAMSARSYFNNTGPLPGFTNNYYGGTFGGPIRNDRTFFFADFLRYSNHSGVYSLFTVRTAAFRTGDLSAGPTPIYDPNTGGNGVGRTQFVTGGTPNDIPSNRISQVSKNIIALIPLPNIPGAGFTNNDQTALGLRVDSDQYDVKFDQSVGKNDHFLYCYSFQHVTTVQDPAFGQARQALEAQAGFKVRARTIPSILPATTPTSSLRPSTPRAAWASTTTTTRRSRATMAPQTPPASASRHQYQSIFKRFDEHQHHWLLYAAGRLQPGYSMAAW